ncbi:uncharacterized protein LOC124126496 [Haliotis rufescens]|uniref:uncharacterized protein LOC124126496 n=1 Tax=Haliotis rufescens TaxID=6454 RepID=UPI00201F7577|nr:uncharacterized protein LOC124126496 [Haliotis rufescens]XP_048236561.1 uncharacterized protein LOC124126496 [Haliotis rufescens]
MVTETRGHSPVLIMSLLLNWTMLILNLLIFSLGRTPQLVGGSYKLLIYDIKDISDKYAVEITPASPMLAIWWVIFVWQGLWMVFALINICRKSRHGPVYVSPVLLSPTLFLTSALNWGVVLGWSLLFDREYLWLAFAFLLLTCLSTYICLGLSYRDMAAHRPTLVKEGRRVDVWLVRVLVQNGLAMYAAWCTFATLLNLAAALAYARDFGISPRTSSTISLGILAGELVLFAISDWTFLDKYSRYTVSPYLVLIVALTGSVVQNWQLGAANSIFTVVLLVVSVIAFLVKIGLTILRHIRETDRRKEAVTTLDDNFTFRF